MVGAAAMVCLILLLVSGYDAIHVHNLVGPLEDAPVAPHHCLLCLAAHMPLSIQAGPAAPVFAFSRSLAQIPGKPGGYESAATFPLYIRPPPQA